MKQKLTAIAVAACLCSCLAAPMMQSSAVDYNALYDVDGNGTVSITDVVSLNQYLMGAFAVTDPSILDINQNGVVDALDTQFLSAYLVGKTVTYQYIDVLTETQSAT